MPSLGPAELVLILVIVLLVFGAGKLPELGAALGKGLREFKKAQAEITDLKTTLQESTTLEPPSPKSPS
jgi:TatA/E family protein of Tat protein translocase